MVIDFIQQSPVNRELLCTYKVIFVVALGRDSKVFAEKGCWGSLFLQRASLCWILCRAVRSIKANDSQNHRMLGVGKNLWRSPSTTHLLEHQCQKRREGRRSSRQWSHFLAACVEDHTGADIHTASQARAGGYPLKGLQLSRTHAGAGPANLNYSPAPK